MMTGPESRGRDLQVSIFRFNLHGLVRGEVRGPEWLTAPVRHELSFHQDSSTGAHEPEPDLIARLGYSVGETSRSRSSRAGARSHNQEAGVFHDWQGRHLIASWQAGMTAAKSPPGELVFHGNRASRFIVSKWIVEPALRIMAHKKGALMMHAAAISDGERAVLIAGAGGTGKTTWVLHWLSAGHPYLSDDFTLFYNNSVLPYVTPLRLGLKNLLINPALKNIGLTNKFNITFRTLIRRLSLGQVKFYFKAPVKTAVPGIKISRGVEIIGAIMLDKTEISGKPNHGKITSDEYAHKLTDIDRNEMHGFGGEHLEKIASCRSGFFSEHHDQILTALSGKPCYLVPARSLPPAEAIRSISELFTWASRSS